MIMCSSAPLVQAPSRIRAACVMALCALPGTANAGILSSLGIEADAAMQSISGAILQVESQVGGAFNANNLLGILQTGKAITTGANQQMQANQQQTNQKLQEEAAFAKKYAATQAVQRYAWQVDGAAQPLGCSATLAAAGNLQAAMGQSAQSAWQAFHTGGFVGGNGASVGPDQRPGNQQVMESLAAQSGYDNNAAALFSSGQSGSQPVVERNLLDPLPPQPLQSTVAATPAGTRYLAAWNSAASALSLASSGLGTVGGMHAFTVPQSAVNSTAQSVGASGGMASAAVSKPPVTASGAPPSSAPASGNGGGSSGNWKKLAPVYATEIANAAAAHNVPPSVLAAIVAQEDGSENLQALAMCGTVSSGQAYNFNGVQSVACHRGNSWYTAKSLTQMIDTTAQASGLPNPMVGTQSANAELNAAATHLQSFMAQCQGNAACLFGAWNYGSVAPGMAQGNFTLEPNEVKYDVAGYVRQAMSRYSGKSAYDVNMYNGGAGGLNTGTSASGTGASTAGLLRISSYGSYANPAWYQKINAAPAVGVWRSIAYLMALQNVVVNQNRVIMEHLSAVMAERLALLQRKRIRGMNALRGQAMQQYANEPWYQKIVGAL